MRKPANHFLDLILDEAQQKGTGKWTSQNALDVGAPIPTINAAVESRILSSLKSQRVAASKVIRGPQTEYKGNRQQLINAARQALYASKITSYAQGLGLLKIASDEYKYDLNMGEIAKIWRAGCIIRANLLGDIMAAFQRDPALVNLLLDETFRVAVEERQEAWRFVVQTAVGMGIPVLALGASLATSTAYRSERLPANLTQAQRDYFGAHTYRRVDREGIFHTEWTLIRVERNLYEIWSEHSSERFTGFRFTRRSDPPARSGHHSVPQGDRVARSISAAASTTCAANLSDCFRMRTGIVSAMVDYPIGDLIAERVRAMGISHSTSTSSTTG